MARATAIGLMSGTSYDGVDVALVETDGEGIGRLGPTGYRPYSDRERDVVRRAIAAAANLTERTARPAVLVEAEELVTDMHAEAVEAFLAANGMPPSAVAVVGFHGQTVLHRPDRGLTIQLGNGAALAGRLGIPVVYDFRAADVAAGGNGAPMVPVFHRAMLRLLKRAHPVGVLNLGGVANVTFINGAKPPPKSLDRNAFRHWVTEEGRLAGKSTPDGAATLTAITAAAVAHAITVLPRPPAEWIVAGGGTRNPTLMRMLAERLAPAPVETAGAVGWSADALEAQAFAYLAVRTLKGLPLTFPTTTGAPRPLPGGILVRP